MESKIIYKCCDCHKFLKEPNKDSFYINKIFFYKTIAPDDIEILEIINGGITDSPYEYFICKNCCATSNRTYYYSNDDVNILGFDIEQVNYFGDKFW